MPDVLGMVPGLYRGQMQHESHSKSALRRSLIVWVLSNQIRNVRLFSKLSYIALVPAESGYVQDNEHRAHKYLIPSPSCLLFVAHFL